MLIVTKLSEKSISVEHNGMIKYYMALMSVRGSGNGVVVLSGDVSLNSDSFTEPYQNITVVESGTPTTFATEAECVSKLCELVNFKTSGGSVNTLNITVNGIAPDENGNITLQAPDVDLSNYYTKSQADSRYATAAQGAKADTSLQVGRISVGSTAPSNPEEGDIHIKTA